MAIQLAPLPFEPDDLEPDISRKTIEVHYGKHHAGYVKTLNKLIEDTEYDSMKLTEIIVESAGKEGLEEKIFNNAGQAWNHAFFWNCLAKQSSIPSENFQKLLEQDFGTYDHFIEQFKKKATDHFGSGWLWLVKDADGHLALEALSNAGTPIVEGETPLLVCDLWEHAYYLDYKNERAKYVDGFMKHINWEFVETRYEKFDNDADLLFRALPPHPPLSLR